MKLCTAIITFVFGVSVAQASNKDKVTNMYREIKKQFSKVPELKLSKAVNNSNIQFIDVRPKKERKVSMIPGAISVDQFEKNMDQYRAKTIVAYCTIGYRSAKYILKLKQKNIKAYNLEGSLLGWVHYGQDVVSSEGKIVKVIHVYGRAWDYPPKGFKGVYGWFF